MLLPKASFAFVSLLSVYLFGLIGYNAPQVGKVVNNVQLLSDGTKAGGG